MKPKTDIEIVAMTEHHAKEVVSHLWARGTVEAIMFGFDPQRDLLKYAIDHANDKYAYAAISTDKTIAVFGAFLVAGNLCRTWFMATDDFKKYYLSLTRQLRKMMAAAVQSDGISGIETYSALIHPAAEKWFTVLGLVRDDNYTPENGLARFVKLVTDGEQLCV